MTPRTQVSLELLGICRRLALSLFSLSSLFMASDSEEYSILTLFDWQLKRHQDVSLSALFMRYGSLKERRLLQKSFADGMLLLACLRSITNNNGHTPRRTHWKLNPKKTADRAANVEECFRLITRAFPFLPPVGKQFKASVIAAGEDRSMVLDLLYWLFLGSALTRAGEQTQDGLRASCAEDLAKRLRERGAPSGVCAAARKRLSLEGAVLLEDALLLADGLQMPRIEINLTPGTERASRGLISASEDEISHRGLCAAVETNLRMPPILLRSDPAALLNEKIALIFLTTLELCSPGQLARAAPVDSGMERSDSDDEVIDENDDDDDDDDDNEKDVSDTEIEEALKEGEEPEPNAHHSDYQEASSVGDVVAEGVYVLDQNQEDGGQEYAEENQDVLLKVDNSVADQPSATSRKDKIKLTIFVNAVTPEGRAAMENGQGPDDPDGRIWWPKLDGHRLGAAKEASKGPPSPAKSDDSALALEMDCQRDMPMSFVLSELLRRLDDQKGHFKDDLQGAVLEVVGLRRRDVDRTYLGLEREAQQLVNGFSTELTLIADVVRHDEMRAPSPSPSVSSLSTASTPKLRRRSPKSRSRKHRPESKSLSPSKSPALSRQSQPQDSQVLGRSHEKYCFESWINVRLLGRGVFISDLFQDLRSGVIVRSTTKNYHLVHHVHFHSDRAALSGVLCVLW